MCLPPAEGGGSGEQLTTRFRKHGGGGSGGASLLVSAPPNTARERRTGAPLLAGRDGRTEDEEAALVHERAERPRLGNHLNCRRKGGS